MSRPPGRRCRRSRSSEGPSAGSRNAPSPQCRKHLGRSDTRTHRSCTSGP
jgi:hypothetical protein